VAGNNPNDAELVEYDDDNVLHLGNHGLDVVDVDEILATAVVWIPNKHETECRWKAIGYDRGGQPTTLICSYDVVRRSLRPITGWIATANERTRYLKGNEQ
jgi:uncharacterized DUF497 family protein